MPPPIKKIRFAVRFVSALFAKYRLAIVIGFVIGSSLFFILPKLSRLTTLIRGTYAIAYVARPTLSDLPLEIQQKISFGLTHVGDTGSVYPAAAQSWQATDSGKTYVFALQKDLRWHDGSPLTSQDVNYQFRDAQIETPDPDHLVVHLPDPYAPLPLLLARPVFKSKLTGLGSYKATSIKKNGNYIESLTLTPVSPDASSPKLRYFFYPTESLARTAFKLGQVRSIADISEPGELDKWPNTRVLSTTRRDRHVGLFFNTESGPFSGSGGKTFRQALAYGLDKTRWSDEERANGPIPPGSWVYSDDIRIYSFDPSKARQLLKKITPLPEKIIISTFPTYLESAEWIKSSWKDLGLEVDISVVSEIPDQFSLLLAAQTIPADPDQYHLWHSTQPANITRFNHPRIDKLLEDGRRTGDLAARKKIYADFQKFLQEELPAIFLYYPKSYSLFRQ